MSVTRAFLTLLLFFASPSLHAQLSFCNKTLKPIDVAVHYMAAPGEWRTKGWFNYAPGECGNAIGGELANRYYYYHATRTDGVQWGGPEGDISVCVRSTAFDTAGCDYADARSVRMRKIDTGETGTSYELNLTMDSETLPEVKVGEIQKRCIASWEDSHQVHSTRVIVEWNYQAVKTKMKKLVHCIELRVTGPVDVEGVAKSYVDQCINHGLNHQKTRHILGLIVAIGADILGGGGAATGAKVADYVSSAANETVDCLTDTDRISAHIGDSLREKFDAAVRHESHWEFWDL